MTSVQDEMRNALGLNYIDWLSFESMIRKIAQELIGQEHPTSYKRYDQQKREAIFIKFEERYRKVMGKELPRPVFEQKIGMAFYSMRTSQARMKRAKTRTYNTKDSNGTTPAVDDCTKSPNAPLSRMLTTEKHISTIQGTHAQNTMHLSSSKGTADSDRSGHKDTTILTNIYRTLQSTTSNKQVAVSYQNLPQWTEKIGKSFGLNESEWDSLKSVSMYHIHKMMGKSFQIPWEEYSDEERQGCFEEIETMFRVITKKTVTRAGLELLIPWLLDPQNHARRKDVEDRKAAAVSNDKENSHVQSSSGLGPPDPLPAIHCMHFDATGNTKTDANKFDNEKTTTLTRRFDPVRDSWL